MSNTWTIKAVNEFNEPYYYKNDQSLCRHLDVNEWEVGDAQKALLVLRDILDVPEAELTIDALRKDFESPEKPLPEEKLVAIQNYYNGRLGIWNTAKKEIEEFTKSLNEDKIFHYEIPEDYNQFYVYDDENEARSKQIQGYVEVSFKMNKQ